MTKSKKNKKKKSPSPAVAVQLMQHEASSEFQKLDTLIEEAEAAVDSFNYVVAESKLQEILRIFPDNSKSLEMLSSVYIELDKWKEAKNLLQQCINISPENGYSKYFSMGQLSEGLESVKYYEKGIQILERELENSENIKPSKDKNDHILKRDLSDAYCSIAEIFMTDCCFEEHAEEKCHAALDMAVKADPNNPESYQGLANYYLVKEQIKEAKESIEKSISLWLPYYDALKKGKDEILQNEIENQIPGYDSRIQTSKVLIELEMFYEASDILEGLLEEKDEVVEVWYLLGWLNYLREEDEYKANAHFYLEKAKEVSQKIGDDSEYVDHINELLETLKSTHPFTEDDTDVNKDDCEDDCTSDTDDDSKMEI